MNIFTPSPSQQELEHAMASKWDGMLTRSQYRKPVKMLGAMAQPVELYFVQDQVCSNEGPHADEVTRAEFYLWASANLVAGIEYCPQMQALFLRLDELTLAGLKVDTP